MEETLEREFYPIREAARLTQVPAHTLRYWETRLRLLKPTRIGGGQRRYTKADLDTIARVRDLVAGGRMTLEGAKKAMQPARVKASAGLDTAVLKSVREEVESIVADMEKFSKEL